MAIHASFQGLGSLGASLAPPVAKRVLPECVSAAKALLASGKAGVLPAQCYADALVGPVCGGSCKSSLKLVASGKSPRMVQRSGPPGDTTCLKNAMSTSPVVCVNGKPAPKAPGAAMDAATASASEQGGAEQGGAEQGWAEDTNYQPGAEEGSPWPLRIGIGAGVGLLVAGALYMKYGRG